MATMAKCLMLVLAFLIAATSIDALHDQINPEIDAIYQFGDSMSDTGNLIRENQRTTFARLPYGQTLHHATGRCSDGLLMIDYIAEYFKLPHLDAYLIRNGNFRHGVNFAVAGSTALSTPSLAARRIMSPATSSSLSVQVAWFRSHLRSICSNPSDCRRRLANALFIVESGGNDFNFAFFQGKPIQQVYSMIPQVIGSIRRNVEDLIRLGATRVVIPGNFPIGCIPIYLTAFQTYDSRMYDSLHCLAELNDFAKAQNEFLQQTIAQLRTEYPHVTFVYADYYSALQGLLQNAASNGFNKDETQKTCCGIGANAYNFDSSRMCGNIGVPVCRYPSRRVSWDGVHMTQHAYKVLAKWLLKHNIVPGLSYSA